MRRFYRASGFEAVQQGGRRYVRHRLSGDLVSVDDALFRLWDAIDGQDASDLQVHAGAALGLSSRLLEAVLDVLVRAGLVVTDEPVLPTAVPQPIEDGPLVSVVVLNMDGVEHLEACLSSLLAQTYRNLEIILVDNGSWDDSVAFTEAHFPAVRIVALERNLGFAGGNNAGFQAASGQYVLALNNDTELDPSCVAEMVRVIERDERTAAVAPMMKLFYLRGFLNGLGNAVPPLGWGTDRYIGHLDVGQFADPEPVPGACFGAALVRRSVWEQIGGLDPGFYPIYYEDSDWCYRARMAGYEVWTAPRAVVYHKFSATMQRGLSPQKLSIVSRNRLRYITRNLRPGSLLRYAPSYLAGDAYRLVHALWTRDWAIARAQVDAWSRFLRSLPEVLRERKHVQRLRLRGLADRELLALTARTPPSQLDENVPLLTLRDIREHYLRVSPDLVYRQILVVSPDVVNANMAGPGIRCWELARVLAPRFEVTLAAPGTCDLAGEGFEILEYGVGRDSLLRQTASKVDVLVVSGYVLHERPFLKDTGCPMVVDLYDPFIIENLHFHAQKPLADRSAIHRNDLTVLNEQVQAGDFFLCASEKQRDYWIGLLTANNRVNPATWDGDPALRELIDVVPFGLRSRPPRADGPRLKGVRKGIGAHDQVILWGGGVWEWLDPLTAIRAMPRVVEACPGARLLFVGIRHPNPNLPDSRMASRAVELSRELGLLDRHVFFNDWTPYAEREAYLIEADAGISTHFDHLETRFAFRTRLLDYFWAGLPVVTSGGDALSDVVATEGLGRVVACEDVDDVANALTELLSMPDAKQQRAPAFARVRERFAWERVAAPLLAFCRMPHHAADKAGSEAYRPGVITVPQPTPVWRLPARAWRIVGERGLRGLGMEVASYVRWLVTRLP